MKIHDFPQGGPEWVACKTGKISASRFKELLAKGQGKTRQNYLYEVAAEILTGQKTVKKPTAAMEWGVLTEPAAREAYMIKERVQIRQVGFVEMTKADGEGCGVGCSPDGLIADDGMLETKCPNTATHIETILSNAMPSEHKPQVQGGLYVCQRKWCDFVSFDPRIQGPASYFKIRVYRDEDYISRLQTEVDRFIVELQGVLSKLQGHSNEERAA